MSVRVYVHAYLCICRRFPSALPGPPFPSIKYVRLCACLDHKRGAFDSVSVCVFVWFLVASSSRRWSTNNPWPSILYTLYCIHVWYAHMTFTFHAYVFVYLLVCMLPVHVNGGRRWYIDGTLWMRSATTAASLGAHTPGRCRCLRRSTANV